MSILHVCLGLALLVAGAQFLVRGASRLAVAAGISPLVVGLTVVAFGTSTPELAVSLRSCLANETGIVLGNVVGANVYNVLLILGLSAVLRPLAVSPEMIRLDVPLMIGVSGLFWLMATGGRLTRLDGVVLVAGIVLYTVFLIRQSRKDVASRDPAERRLGVGPDRPRWVHVAYVIAGLGLLTAGSTVLVQGAVAAARALGVSELMIAMTVVTAGTTAPELTASLVATLRGERDIAVGNVVGSNIFNILAVLGTGAIVAPHGIVVEPEALAFGIPVLTLAAVACLPVFFAGHSIARWEGTLFLFYFLSYVTRLVLEAKQSALRPWFDTGVLFYIAPVTLLAIGVSVYREFRHRSPAAPVS